MSDVMLDCSYNINSQQFICTHRLGFRVEGRISSERAGRLCIVVSNHVNTILLYYRSYISINYNQMW